MSMEEKRESFEQRKENPETVEKQADAVQEKATKQSTDKAVTEYIDMVQRLQAEFENYKKRTEKEKQDAAVYGKASLLKELLGVVDSFELALKAMSTTNIADISKGIDMVYKHLLKLLEAEGVKPIEAVGVKLDPFRHEVLMQKESEHDEGMIIEEMQRGYMFRDKVLRASKVAVSKKAAKEEKNGGN